MFLAGSPNTPPGRSTWKKTPWQWLGYPGHVSNNIQTSTWKSYSNDAPYQKYVNHPWHAVHEGEDGAGHDPAVAHLVHQTTAGLSTVWGVCGSPDVHHEQELGDEGSIIEAKDEAGAEVEDATVCRHQERRKRTWESSCCGQDPAVEDQEMIRHQS